MEKFLLNDELEGRSLSTTTRNCKRVDILSSIYRHCQLLISPVLSIHGLISLSLSLSFIISNEADDAIIIKDASFKWNKSGPATLFDINLHLRRGELLTVVGPVGSGKSSLLFAILGEMVTEKGIMAARVSILIYPPEKKNLK